jgi:hypothetical protein
MGNNQNECKSTLFIMLIIVISLGTMKKGSREENKKAAILSVIFYYKETEANMPKWSCYFRAVDT